MCHATDLRRVHEKERLQISPKHVDSAGEHARHCGKKLRLMKM